MRLIVGTKVINIQNMYVTVLSGSEVRSILGGPPSWNSGTWGAAVNGDEAARTYQVHTLLNDGTGAMDCRVRTETGGNPSAGMMRFNWIIVDRS